MYLYRKTPIFMAPSFQYTIIFSLGGYFEALCDAYIIPLRSNYALRFTPYVCSENKSGSHGYLLVCQCLFERNIIMWWTRILTNAYLYRRVKRVLTMCCHWWFWWHFCGSQEMIQIHDRGNQATVGMFVSTWLKYCVL